ncbi:hypothetical protein Nmel_018514 [Mimus melanotis]
MGSRMPNCLRTAMKRRMTTATAHSSMPWMPMAPGGGWGFPPQSLRGCGRWVLRERGAGAAARVRLSCPHPPPPPPPLARAHPRPPAAAFPYFIFSFPRKVGG